MAVGKEIRKQIKSIQNTQKITRAMEMVAASKMRKAQERMQAARPYAFKIRNVITHLHYAHPEYRHPFVIERDAKRVGFIVITSDRGLCGGLNTNLLRSMLATMKEWSQKKTTLEICTIGGKGFGFMKRLGANIVSHTSHLGDTPRLEDLIGTLKVMLDAYTQGELDRLYLVYNHFVNTMSQKPEVELLLPLPPSELEGEKLTHHWDYIYEPDSKEVLDDLLTRYIESLVYHGVIENLACEQSARMVAMKSASDNAGGLIDELKLRYNKARQAAITQEIAEIVGGAAAV
ncbi:MAG: F0F1 ATP synthase subunit gamma [Candidatus Muproteobacteria bacterium RIFCSPHIGHO2_12_FULL_60_33]|uniref:ATP synthase gamma chain n=1 Tax=Candidatus Muproteobacteria bacterium RIFCSPLOWO2_01_FULL_60_18 TaxID=1817768 RepID=A0A1F6U678_9PROT|nr:MAG: F0F1 ATP synthase subunit gamma [Candidatus Muproteobacteria bacterium RIFCSPLOWO2_01_FULL_60_18]OGI56381.1 MAG: F0F1 ATP synthase subunit gamma [Candidatus Muproteobacteria bacterium RIFCSPHIGHO2_12_FULL_60_33]OGI56724.1 MAG: F0F1 ATP synthase subunit gamma [Candidatus Muproteobacteria bacterium RIFCSPHIGHO2_02_FULL_60_13]OGI59301.1 MAG: F0F1 ATP synthase subunit gamma [Candidatus Muproteobacteria bacterium RIFCSPHIGHO2_01_FULL_61_200]